MFPDMPANGDRIRRRPFSLAVVYRSRSTSFHCTVVVEVSPVLRPTRRVRESLSATGDTTQQSHVLAGRGSVDVRFIREEENVLNAVYVTF